MRKSRFLVLVYLVQLGLLGCIGAEEKTSESIPKCKAGGDMSATPEMPPGVIVQSVLENPEGETAGYRIYRDGRYESKTIAQPWTLGDSLTPTQVAAVVKIISESNFDQLESHYQPERPVEDANTLWMQIDDDGRRFVIAIEGSCEVSAIRTFSERILEVFRQKNSE